MAFIFETTDQWGRAIVLQRTRWTEHVLIQHPELAEHVDAIQETIVSPHVLTLDVRWEQGENYYRASALPEPYTRLYLKVCVHFDLDNSLTGRVITAYLTDRIKSSEEHKWSIQTS